MGSDSAAVLLSTGRVSASAEFLETKIGAIDPDIQISSFLAGWSQEVGIMQIQTSPPPPIPVNFLVPSLPPLSSSPPPPPPPSSSRVETLSSLCQWWGDTKQDPLPSICHQFVSPDRLDGRWAVVPPQFYSHGHNQLVRHPAPSSNLVSTPFGAGRSISLIGILGGVLFILLIVAFITCIRRRKRWSGSVRDAESDGDLLAAHLHPITQRCASRRPRRRRVVCPLTPKQSSRRG